MRDKAKEDNERGEVCFEFMCKTTHLCLFNTVCVHRVVYVCECLFMSHSTKAEGDKNVHLLRAALLKDFIKT